jgi:hypothetical protein
MRKILWCAAAAVVFLVPSQSWSQQTDPKPAEGSAPAPTESPSSTVSAQASGPAPDSLAEAARKARQEKKDAPKTPKVFTNENIPNQGGISSVGQGSGPGGPASSDANATVAGAKPASGGEQMWRDKFAQLRHKLAQDQESRELMQRELGVDNVQFYGDPVKQMQQGLTNGDINKKRSDIDQMDKQIVADQQAISDAEEDLRKSGGDPGWSR